MKAKVIVLALCFVVTGSLNTLSTKLADETPSRGIPSEPIHDFNHPFVQAVGMFIGEIMCFIPYFLVERKKQKSEENIQDDNGIIKEEQKFNPFWFLIPAMCDMCGTSLMYVGLTLTYASVFQMLRGSIVVYTGLISWIYLKKKFSKIHWMGMLYVVVGLALVGLSSVLGAGDKKDASKMMLGNLLIIGAQVIGAVQGVYEEKIFMKNPHIHPLLAVGCEGTFGAIILGLLLIPMGIIKVGPRPFENSLDAVTQIGNSTTVLLALFGNMLSIAFFNFFGMAIVKETSATTRMILDSLRTVVIWAVSLSVGWEKFQVLQLMGFAVLLSGIFIYNMPKEAQVRETPGKSINYDDSTG